MKVTRVHRIVLLFVAVLAVAADGSAQWNPEPNGTISYTAGNVGIGTTTPGDKLHVAGTVTAGPVGSDAYRFYGAADTNKRWALATTASGAFAIIMRGNDWVDQGTALSIDRTGKVGVGTTDPRRMIHLHGSSALLLTNPSTGATADDGFQIIQNGLTTYLEQQEAGSLIMRTNALDRVTVDGSGNVGIGTSAPDRKLHVGGDARVTGGLHVGSITSDTAITAVYQDLAEWVPATTDLAPGTVVILNAAKSNEVMASQTAYDTAVAGVVSEQPGVILGVGGSTKEMVATTGRVKVRVDARSMPIRVGDLLVTSDVPGTAMKSEPVDLNGRKFHQPGTIIGKALEPLDGGTGEILVLLSMQ